MIDRLHFLKNNEDDLTVIPGYLEPIVLPDSLCGGRRLEFSLNFGYSMNKAVT